MKAIVSIIALAIVVVFSAPVLAAESTPQPLTRADCDKAGMKWDDQALACAGKASGSPEKKGHVKKKPSHGNKKHSHGKVQNDHGTKAQNHGKFKWPWQWQTKKKA